MAAFHELEVSFALDAMGSGYSSLIHLRQLPAHLIKVDQNLVHYMLECADELAIVEGAIGLARTFNRKVIAGV